MDCAAHDDAGWHWDPVSGQGTFLPYPQGPGYWLYSALGMNDQNDIVGFTRDDQGGTPMFASLWRNGEIYDLSDLVVPGTAVNLWKAYDINSRGQIVLISSQPRAYLLNPIITGDVNSDFVVNVLDLLLVLGAWGPCPGCPEDINDDNVVDVLDLLELLANWS
jgi:hypothetical protein